MQGAYTGMFTVYEFSEFDTCVCTFSLYISIKNVSFKNKGKPSTVNRNNFLFTYSPEPRTQFSSQPYSEH